MPMFRKRPVVIEAWLWDGTEATASALAAAGLLVWPKVVWPEGGTATDLYDANVTIRTLEGEMTASKGDWIIKGVKGEFYPCKPDIFAATYEAA